MTGLGAAAAFPAVASAVIPSATYPSTVNDANAPTGTHFANGSTPPTCTVGPASDPSVTCGDGAGSNQSYTLQGVGNTDATLNLVAHYTQQIQCTNGGNNVVEAQQTSASSGPTRLTPSKKNGNMTVPAAAVPAPPTSGSGKPCPNRNWTWTALSTTLTSFEYTLTFDGFSGPYISNSQTDP